MSAREILRRSGARMAGAIPPASGAALIGPEGAVLAAPIGFENVAQIVIDQVLGRPQARAGAALALIEGNVRDRERRYEKLRDDGFFDERDGVRPEAHDLLEAILLAAAASYEERSVPFLARLWTATAFDPELPANDSLYVVRLANELTYRQLTALAVYAASEHERELDRAQADYEIGRVWAPPALLLEIDDLGRRRLLDALGENTFRNDQPFRMNVAPLSSRGPGAVRLTTGGELLVRLLGLATIPAEDQLAWVAARIQRAWS